MPVQRLPVPHACRQVPAPSRLQRAPFRRRVAASSPVTLNSSFRLRFPASNSARSSRFSFALSSSKLGAKSVSNSLSRRSQNCFSSFRRFSVRARPARPPLPLGALPWKSPLHQGTPLKRRRVLHLFPATIFGHCGSLQSSSFADLSESRLATDSRCCEPPAFPHAGVDEFVFGPGV